ncbi:MAG: hypothetical protein ACD_28C00162G0003 [uncultured bacterium]|nr:MAG: hypothetical protein ACD_28C00162G0003 [uncultured bacterium]KKT76998.1 MAG: hypothetical protein UW70_C0006G0004 [Candidatus Peregrinibacteria bacterium GW2011_GWA2_44_7]
MVERSEGFDRQESEKLVLRTFDEILKRFDKESEDYGRLDDFKYAVEQGDFPKNTAQYNRMTINGVHLTVAARDNEEDAFRKLNEFLSALKAKLNPEAQSSEVTKDREVVRRTSKAVTQPLVPEKGYTEWRDVNSEIVEIGKAFQGMEEEPLMKNLREKSHGREIGKENLHLEVGGVILDIKKGERNETLLTKLSRFVAAVKANNPERFVVEKKSVQEAAPAAPDKIFWRDVIAGIDGLVKAYPDKDYSSLTQLRAMMESGEVGQGMNLLMTVGPIHLWIKKTDSDEMIKEKIAVFIGELKQVASALNTREKEKEKPLDPESSRTYWRDIEGAIDALEPVFGEDGSYKLLRMSVKKGILGTVKNFHAIIGGVILDIKQSDTDTQMRDKLSAFIRELSKGGEIKMNDETRKSLKQLEQKYHQLEENSLDLENRYKKANGDLNQRTNEIIRLEDHIRKLQDELAREKQKSSYTPPPYQTTRSYSG